MIPDNFEIEDINEAIRLPNPGEIILPDGRVLEINSWEPLVSKGEPVSVKIEAFIDFTGLDSPTGT
jgi:hypothetical protein